MNTIETQWRPAFELYSATFWIIGAITTALIGTYGEYGVRFMLLISLPMILLAMVRMYQGVTILNARAALFAIKDLTIQLKDVIEWQQNNPDSVMYGKGFYWDVTHSQKIADLEEKQVKSLKPHSSFMKARNILGLDSKFKENDANGNPLLHGIEKEEIDIIQSLEHRFSHESVGGASGTGKGRKLAFDVIQAIVRGEGVMIIDPKFDENLLDLVHATLKLMGQEEKLYCFTPASPLKSCRLNPYINYTEIAELTQRTLSLFADEKEDVFKSFAWSAVHTVMMGLDMVGQNITLKQILKYLQREIDDLLVLAGTKYFSDHPSCKRVTQTLLDNSLKMEARAKIACEQYQKMNEEFPNSVMDSIVSVFLHDRSHYKKLYANIIPPLRQLTGGAVGDLLSPDKLSDDPRPVIDIKRIAQTGSVLYVNLASLRDPIVGNGIGSLILADTISVIADRYFNSKGKKLIPFNVYGDESSDYVNEAAINLANKSRGSKSAFKFYFQTTSDLTDRLGSQAKANKMLGNTNTQTTLRAADPESSEFFCSKLPKVTVNRTTSGVTTQTTTAKDDIDFNTGYGKQNGKIERSLVEAGSLRSLMTLHCFTQFPSGELAKIRVPFIPCPEELKYSPQNFVHDAYGNPRALEELLKIKNESIKEMPE